MLPAPAVLASLQLPTIPAEEAGTSTQGVSVAMGNPSGEGASSSPVMKAGTSHNPGKGKQAAQGKAKQPAQGEAPTDHPFSLGEGLPIVPTKLAGRIRRGGMWTWLNSSETTSRQSGGGGRSPTTPPAPGGGGGGGGRKGQVAGDSRPLELGAMFRGVRLRGGQPAPRKNP